MADTIGGMWCETMLVYISFICKNLDIRMHTATIIVDLLRIKSCFLMRKFSDDIENFYEFFLLFHIYCK